jgi:hypothetical protein
VVKQFTGKIQYAKNDAAEATTALGKSLRGEVHQVSERQKKVAIDLVNNGRYSHVAADTPLGQPEELALVGKKQTNPGEPESDTSGTARTTSTAKSETTGSTSSTGSDTK